MLDVQPLLTALMTALLQRRFIESPANLSKFLSICLVRRLKAGVVAHGALATRRLNQTALAVHVLVHQSLDAVVVATGCLKAQLGAVFRSPIRLRLLLAEARERPHCLLPIAVVDSWRRVLDVLRSQYGWHLPIVIESLKTLATRRNGLDFLSSNFHEFEIDFSLLCRGGSVLFQRVAELSQSVHALLLEVQRVVRHFHGIREAEEARLGSDSRQPRRPLCVVTELHQIL